MNKFDSIVEGAFDIAHTDAMKRKNNELAPEHLLLGLIKSPSSFVSKALKTYKKEIEETLNGLPVIKGELKIDQIHPSSKLSEWITYASSHVISSGRIEMAEKDLLRFLPQICPNLKIDFEKFSDEAENDQEGEVPSFLVNLNELAEEGKLDPVIGRNSEIRAVMEILGRRSKNNPVLVGPAGVGKTAIAEGLAREIVKGDVPEVLKDKTVYSLEMGLLMAGTKFRGEFEERLTNLIKFLRSKSGQSILFIDEIHQLVGAGKTDGAMDAANLLKPALARGELHCVGATTPEEYQKYILNDSALDRRFRSVPVNAPSREDAIEILMGLKEKFEIHHGIRISDEAIYNAVVLSEQYIPEKNLPDKAIDLLDESSSALKLSVEAMPVQLVELQAEIRSKKILAQIEKKNKNILKEIDAIEKQFTEEKEIWEREVLSVKQISSLKNQLENYRFELEQAERAQDYETASKLKYSLIPEIMAKLEGLATDWILYPKHIAMVISREKGIPVEKILKSKQDDILELEKCLKERVYGQDSALHEISDTILASHAGLTDPTRPLGSFLLRGPSGVGKTETAKALTQFLFNNERNLIRLDMSEYSEKHSVSKLIGAAAGYIGYEEGGILTEAVRKKPYSVILFDEIEKAHRDFSDILLQILDDGRLTDNKGRTISFLNTVLILTTNSKNIEQDFKPEVLGRIDGICDYNQLDNSIMDKLVAKEIIKLNDRLKDKEVFIALDEKAKEIISKRGFDPRYGARPLTGVFNRYITRPLSKMLLKGDLKAGEILIKWDSKADRISF